MHSANAAEKHYAYYWFNAVPWDITVSNITSTLEAVSINERFFACLVVKCTCKNYKNPFLGRGPLF